MFYYTKTVATIIWLRFLWRATASDAVAPLHIYGQTRIPFIKKVAALLGEIGEATL